MLEPPTAASWTRCTYDHRLRTQVVRAGTGAIQNQPPTPMRACGRILLPGPQASIELEEAGLAASSIAIILERDTTASAPDLAAKLIDALGCDGSAVRQLSARALKLLATLGPQDAEAVCKQVTSDHRADVRALTTSVLAAHRLNDARSLKVLERGLADRAEVVRLGAANALVHLTAEMTVSTNMVNLLA